MVSVAILGGGPIGLEAAVAGVARGFDCTIFEGGKAVAAHVRRWGHVRLFSSNALNASEAGRALLGANPQLDDEYYPTGLEYVESYLEPLATALRARGVGIRLGARVVSVGRGAVSKGTMGATARRAGAFRVLIELEGGGEEYVEGFDAVVDATGTFASSKWFGKGGAPALGERSLSATHEAVSYHLPDFASADAVARYFSPSGAGDAQRQPRTTAVIGSGASAVTALRGLEAACNSVADRRAHVVWLSRAAPGVPPYTVIENDPLPQRDSLNKFGNDLASVSVERDPGDAVATASGGFTAEYVPGAHVLAISAQPLGDAGGDQERGDRSDDHALQLIVECDRVPGDAAAAGAATQRVVLVDNVLAMVGYKPDMTLTAELQLHYCYASEGPMKLAASLLAAGGGGGDCLAQTSSGKETMLTPEPGLFVVGMKSYGRGSAFLLRIGHEQVLQVMELIAADFK